MSESGDGGSLPQPLPKVRDSQGDPPAARVASPNNPLLQQQTSMLVSQSYQGLIPPPAWMQAYNESIPDGADRILRMAEAQEQHRLAIERTKVDTDAYSQKRGLSYGLIVALAGLIIGGVLIYLGHDTAGAVIAGAPLASMVGIFVYGRTAQGRERAAQRALMQEAMASKDRNQQKKKRRR